MLRTLLFASLLLLTLMGCEPAPQAPKQPAPSSVIQLGYGRFQPVEGGSYGIALDTKTGELCRTYNVDADTYVPATGTFHVTGAAGHPSLDSTPLCIDLSQNEAATVRKILDANQKAESSTDEQKMRQDLERMQKEVNGK